MAKQNVGIWRQLPIVCYRDPARGVSQRELALSLTERHGIMRLSDLKSHRATEGLDGITLEEPLHHTESCDPAHFLPRLVGTVLLSPIGLRVLDRVP